MAQKQRRLNDDYISTLKPAPKGEQEEVMDLAVAGLGIRYGSKKTDKGFARGSYFLSAVYPGDRYATRRKLGDIGQLTVKEARERAQEWRGLIQAGKDPAVEEAELRAAIERQKAGNAANTLGKAMEAYFRHISDQKRADSTQKDIERDLLDFWRDKPLLDITPEDVATRIEEIATGKNRTPPGFKWEGKKPKPRGASPHQAHAAFGNLRTFFKWAKGTRKFGVKISPTADMDPRTLIQGGRKPRQRMLSDEEVRAFWNVADQTPGALGAAYKVLLLTGARLNEILESEWKELSADGNLLTIPRERFKSDAEHLIPLSPLAAEIIATVPKWKKCDFIFSREGDGPLRAWTRDREKLQKDMLAVLKQLAAERGGDPAKVELKPFVLHDLRRTVRTHLSALRVQEAVAEAVVGHGKKGLDRVYNLHRYLPEMREALEAWALRLKSIVEPAPPKLPEGNVVPIRRKA